MSTHTYFPQLRIRCYLLKLHFSPAGLKQQELELNFISSSEKRLTVQLGIGSHWRNALFQDIVSLGELLTSCLCNAQLALRCFRKSSQLSVLSVGTRNRGGSSLPLFLHASSVLNKCVFYS